MSKAILVTGATGKQGGAVVNQLLDSNYEILALTRDPSSASAQKLAQKSPKIKLLQGDMNDAAAVFERAKELTGGALWGVFSVQVPMGKGQNAEIEEKQGKAMVDEALKHGVKHFVYTSVDRAGAKSPSNPTNIPHFISKHNVEEHLRQKSANSEMNWTILRPVAFFDNLTPDFMGKTFATMWRDTVAEKPLQLIAVTDIGYFAAQAFKNPDDYKNRAISLAGDDLTFQQANKIFKEKYGYDIPTTFSFIGAGVKFMVREMGTMFQWFYDEGYGADIAELKKIHPGLLDFSAWLDKEGRFQKL